MKLILAIIRPEKLSAVQTALDRSDVFLVTASEVVDCRREQCSVEIYRGREVRRPATRLRLEVAVADEFFDEAVATIRHAAGSGQIGDGKVFVMGLDEYVPLRLNGRRTELFAVHN
jgi:nitrogen regulatory protein P-II 2